MHTGHKYGAHFVLYEGSPDECHSRYCVHVTGGGGGGGDSWGHMKTVTRLMPVSCSRPLIFLLLVYTHILGASFFFKPSSVRVIKQQKWPTSRANHIAFGGYICGWYTYVQQTGGAPPGESWLSRFSDTGGCLNETNQQQGHRTASL